MLTAWRRPLTPGQGRVQVHYPRGAPFFGECLGSVWRGDKAAPRSCPGELLCTLGRPPHLVTTMVIAMDAVTVTAQPRGGDNRPEDVALGVQPLRRGPRESRTTPWRGCGQMPRWSWCTTDWGLWSHNPTELSSVDALSVGVGLSQNCKPLSGDMVSCDVPAGLIHRS